jgi:hypothetical protein
MGELNLVVDPYAIDKESVQGWIDNLKSLPNAGEFLSVPKDTTVVITDNLHSPNVTIGNRDKYGSNPDYAGFTQQKQADKQDKDENGKDKIKPLLSWINPVHPKDQVKVLVHELTHVKNRGIAGGDDHEEIFYRKLYDALKMLGIKPDQARTGPDGKLQKGEDTGRYNFDPPKAEGDGDGGDPSSTDKQSSLLDRSLKASDASSAFGGREINAADATKAALKAGAFALNAAALAEIAQNQGHKDQSKNPGSNLPGTGRSGSSSGSSGGSRGHDGQGHEPGDRADSGGNPSQGGSSSNSDNGGGRGGDGSGGRGGGVPPPMEMAVMTGVAGRGTILVLAAVKEVISQVQAAHSTEAELSPAAAEMIILEVALVKIT